MFPDVHKKHMCEPREFCLLMKKCIGLKIGVIINKWHSTKSKYICIHLWAFLRLFGTTLQKPHYTETATEKSENS